MTELTGSTLSDLNWLLDDLVTRVAPVSQAVVLSSDGLLLGSSDGLSRESSATSTPSTTSACCVVARA